MDREISVAIESPAAETHEKVRDEPSRKSGERNEKRGTTELRWI